MEPSAHSSESGSVSNIEDVVACSKKSIKGKVIIKSFREIPFPMLSIRVEDETGNIELDLKDEAATKFAPQIKLGKTYVINNLMVIPKVSWDNETALLAVEDELGDAAQQIEFCPIGNVQYLGKDGQLVNVRGWVTASSPIIQTASTHRVTNEPLIVRDVILKDSTGEIHLALWQENAENNPLVIGQFVELINAQVTQGPRITGSLSFRLKAYPVGENNENGMQAIDR